ncbi:substrate-binding domain-containing protein [Microbispora triticiradicis]|uniref:substrate-binding domain-containing protein n=1 Tax=Microbispora triticiradicis TaxID=2200763 RepID=UPI001AD7A82E|nr:substrate-binding domain-containing protein [Microbispora triticiradicis]MBO4272736.1 substrate-binding domain-containing protein [Microbispora triticiradicis]
MGRRLAGVCVLLLASVSACGQRGEEREAGLGAIGTIREGFTVGLLLPREGPERALFTRALTVRCPRCRVEYANAAGDRARQGRQIGRMLADGVRVLVLGAVDPGSAAPWVARAKLAGAKVVAYDRLADGPVDAYVSTDPARAGRMQALALLGAMKRPGPVLLLNGPPGDPYAAAVKRSLHAVLDGRVTIARERDLARPGDAAREVAAALAALGGPAKVAGVCCPGDAAEAVAAALARAGAAGVPLVGQGGRTSVPRRPPTEASTVTVRADVAAEAAAAARLAVEVAGGRTVYGTATVSNGTTASIPAVLVPPVVVTKDSAAGPRDAGPAGPEGAAGAVVRPR